MTWDNRKYDLTNSYRYYDADVILITSHELKDTTRFKIQGYRVHQSNLNNEPMDGVAIAVKRKLCHRIEDTFNSKTLTVGTDTIDGKVIIATTYLPPRQPYLPHPDFLRLLRRLIPVFLAGDLNTGHKTLGTTQVVRDLVNYLRYQTARYLLPSLHTMDAFP